MQRYVKTSVSLLALCCCLCAGQDAQNNTSNPSANGERVGWISPDARRSTWDIIWSCFTIFLVCSWKCTHLNIPSTAESLGKWRKWHGLPYWPTRPLAKKWGRKVGFMFVIAIAPELVVGLALRDFLDARKAWKRAGGQDGPYTMMHAFYANMGGLVLRLREPEVPENQEDTNKEAPSHRKRQVCEIKERFLSLADFAALEEIKFPVSITEEDIKDHSKADSFTKLFAISQSAWLVIQSIARVSSSLAITQLELMTMAFVFCAFITYMLWWDKPFDVDRRHVLVCPESQRSSLPPSVSDPRSSWHLIAAAPDGQLASDFRIEELLWESLGSGIDNWHRGDFFDSLPTISIYFVGAIFSAIHLAGWNWEFPGPITQTMWRAFGVTAVVSSILPIPGLVIVSRIDEGLVETITLIVLALFYFSYIVSRFGLLVLSIYLLSSLPATVYEELQWTAWLPHFS